MVKVSVVIPVYNVERYLSQCLDSVINQTLKDIEIICINDGSTDGSLKILEEYTKKDNRIQVYSQENQGHAIATNRGIQYAKGKYLYLMDSDDYLDLTALEKTYKKAEEKEVDFLIFKSLNYDDENNEIFETNTYSMNSLNKIVKNDVFTYQDLGYKIFEINVTPWCKLYNREFIQRNKIEFPEGFIFDDNVFHWKVLFNSKNIYFLDEFLFIRRRHLTSTTTLGNKSFVDSIAISNMIFDIFKEFNLFEKYKKILYNKKIYSNLFRLKNIQNEYKEYYFNTWKKDLLKIINNKNFADDFKNHLNDKNKKIYEGILLSTTYNEFLLFENTLKLLENLK